MSVLYIILALDNCSFTTVEFFHWDILYSSAILLCGRFIILCFQLPLHYLVLVIIICCDLVEKNGFHIDLARVSTFITYQTVPTV